MLVWGLCSTQNNFDKEYLAIAKYAWQWKIVMGHAYVLCATKRQPALPTGHLVAHGNRPVSQMRAPLGGLSRTTGSYAKTTRAAICFEHKTQYLLIHAPYTRIVVFWHISNISPMISLKSQISCNAPTFCIAAIFVKFCYTTDSWLL